MAQSDPATRTISTSLLLKRGYIRNSWRRIVTRAADVDWSILRCRDFDIVVSRGKLFR
jgi:hypothetical protein